MDNYDWINKLVGNDEDSTFELCNVGRLSEYTHHEVIKKLFAEIDRDTDDYINDIDEKIYIEFLMNKYSLKVPFLDFENPSFTTGKKLVPYEKFPSGFRVWRGESYEMPVLIYYLNCLGDVNLLKYHADYHFINTTEVFIEDNSLCFEIVDFYKDAEKLKVALHSEIESIKKVIEPLIKEIERFNHQLPKRISEQISKRKDRITDIRDTLGIPIRKKENLPETLTIPVTKKIVLLKPQTANDDKSLDCALDDSIYQDILQALHDYGSEFERSSSLYIDKDEETLRDHFLFVLSPRYDWTAVGEAFNKDGKTDILIRYKNKTAFIAECKFWHGRKGYLETIDQLFDRYLLWRNSKAAIIIFVKNRDFSSVINEAREITPEHKNFVRFENEKDETWINYIFHINDNPSREVKLAVLLFHIPNK